MTILIAFAAFAVLGTLAYFLSITNEEAENQLDNLEEPPLNEIETDFDSTETPIFTDNEAPFLSQTYERGVLNKYAYRFICVFANDCLDAKQYGSDGRLEGVMTDAKNVWDYFKSKGDCLNIHGEVFGLDFERDVIHNTAATAKAMKEAVVKVAKIGADLDGLKYFLLYESGHGGQTWNRYDNDKDQYAETKCCYDALIIDDEWRKFVDETLGEQFHFMNEIDRCYSGGVARMSLNGATNKSFIVPKTVDCLFLAPIKRRGIKGKAKSKYLSASSENETAADMGATVGGLYTSFAYKLRRYFPLLTQADLIAACRRNCKPTQTPRLFNAEGKKTDWKDTSIIDL